VEKVCYNRSICSSMVSVVEPPYIDLNKHFLYKATTQACEDKEGR
jgi:hypothetical protein